MSPRKYEQRVRAVAADETRNRILEAMYARLRSEPAATISVDQVARDAGVARSTIYLVFESRAGLFDALAAYVLERSGFAAISAAVQEPDALEHLRRSIRASCAMYAADLEVMRSLLSTARTGSDAVAGAVQRLEENRMGGMRHLARRLDEQGYLRADVSQKEAVDTLWLLTSLEAFDLLHTTRNLSPGRAADRLVTTAVRALLE